MRDAVMIVGCGMMGSSIGAMAALAGHRTILVDVDEAHADRGHTKAQDCIRQRQANGLAGAEDARRAMDLLEHTASLEDAAAHARLVIEAIVEDLPAKQEMFARLDALLPPQVTLCSNTSGLQITRIAARCQHPERTLTTHFWLPGHLVPLVEVVMGEKTALPVAEAVMAELKAWGKEPVLVRRDLPGQLANRIFQAIIREAVDIVASGLASAEDVDKAIGCGMAMRFPVWGPLKHLDAIGLPLGLSVQDSVLPDICADRTAGAYLRELVANGQLGAGSGHGFYDWTERDIAEDIRIRDRYIIEAVKLRANIKGE